jgi:hypothetical protein
LQRSSVIKARRPLAKDHSFLDYEVDSDEEWEDDGEGESVGSDDDDSAGSENAGDDDDEDEDGEEDDVSNTMFRYNNSYLSIGLACSSRISFFR